MICNELLEAIYHSDRLTPTEYKLFLCLIRNTYGYNRKECFLENLFLVKELGISKSHVSDCIQSLIKKNMIFKRKESYGINKYYLTWKSNCSEDSEQSSVNPEQKFPKSGTVVPKIRNYDIPQTTINTNAPSPLNTTLNTKINTTSYIQRKREKYFKSRLHPILTNEEMDLYIKSQGEEHV
jgi:phage replication O-like protein O